VYFFIIIIKKYIFLSGLLFLFLREDQDFHFQKVRIQKRVIQIKFFYKYIFFCSEKSNEIFYSSRFMAYKSMLSSLMTIQMELLNE
jgi:hypothetical protein